MISHADISGKYQRGDHRTGRDIRVYPETPLLYIRIQTESSYSVSENLVFKNTTCMQVWRM